MRQVIYEWRIADILCLQRVNLELIIIIILIKRTGLEIL
jgi:hypothetical protein